MDLKKIVESKKTIPGILIEGDDYSGKSTISHALEKKLQAIGTNNIIYNHYYLSNHPLTSLLVTQAKSFSDKEKKQQLFAVAAMIDYDLFTLQPDHFYIQDRNWLSHLNKNKCIDKNIILKKRIPFAYNVFLTVSCQEQKKRMPPDKNLASLYYKKETLRALIPKQEHWLFIDTSHKSIDAVISEIIYFIGL